MGSAVAVESLVDGLDALAGAGAGCETMFARDEQLLVDTAHTLQFEPLRKTLDYRQQRVDAELGTGDGTEPSVAPTFTLIPVGDLVAVDGHLDPLGGAIVGTAIESIADQFAAADRACG